jgi:chaperone modulatory protein CbpM
MPNQQLMRHTALTERLTLEELAATAGLHPNLVERVIDYGLLEQVHLGTTPFYFDMTAVRRLRTIGRLREDLGINLPGIAVILDLLDRIASLQLEVRILRRQHT